MNLTELKAAVSDRLTAIDRELIDLSDFIHAHPELGHHEVQAVKVLTDYLRGMGFEVETGVGGFATAFRAVLRGLPGGSAVAFTAEYDALPEIGHACGHNVIAAAAVGAASAFTGVMDNLPGTVLVVGTPAEEVPPPVKGLMAKAGVFSGVDVAMIIHGGDRTCTGAHSLALQGATFTYHGKPAHAAKCPEEGVSALDGALLAVHGIEMLREHVRSDVRIHGIISDGGSRPNIVPERAVLRYMVRSKDSGYLDHVVARVLRCAEAGALASGATLTTELEQKVDAKLLVKTLDERLAANAAKAGAESMLEPDKDVGSTDFGNLSRDVPASTLKVAVKEPGMSGQVHTPEFCRAAGGPKGHAAVRVGARAMAWTACEILTDPGLLEQIRSEWRAARG